MSHYSGAGIFHTMGGTTHSSTSASTPAARNQSSLFPLHTKDARTDTMATPQNKSERGHNPSAPPQTPTMAPPIVTLPSMKKPHEKKDDKTKNEPFLTKPTTHKEDTDKGDDVTDNKKDPKEE
jgi:hypothetical protein